jgi:hypothetical protein
MSEGIEFVRNIDAGNIQDSLQMYDSPVWVGFFPSSRFIEGPLTQNTAF